MPQRGIRIRLCLEYNISPDGLVPNLLAFNVGVEIGQLTALAMILIAMGYWRRTDSFWRHANRGSADVTITLKTNGAYSAIKRMV